MTTHRRRYQRGSLLRTRREWVLRYRVDAADVGTARTRRPERRLHVGSTADLTRSAARAAADAMIDGITGRTISAGSTLDACVYLTRYEVTRLALKRPATRTTVRSILRQHVRPALRALRLDEVNAGTAQQLIGHLAQQGLSPSTIRSIAAVLRAVLRAARQDGYTCAHIDWRALEFPARVEAPSERKAFTAAQVSKLLGVVPYPWKAVYAIAATLGLRAGETLGLSWGDIDFRRATVRIRQSAVNGVVQGLKSRSSAAVLPASAELAAILREYRDVSYHRPGALLFRSRTGKPLHASWYRRRLARHCKALGLPHRSPHAFRHFAASQLLAAGLSPAAVRDQLRHSNLAMTNAYVHREHADLRRGAEILGKLTGSAP